MSISISVAKSLAYVSTIIRNQRMGVSNMEPGLTAANMTLQRLLAAPFRWRFNRVNLSVSLTGAGGTDYAETIADFGFLETQWLVDTTNKVYELAGSMALSVSGSVRRPQRVAPMYQDDTAGTVTFRVDAIPDKAYTMFLDYQKRAPVLTSFADTFEPATDEFSYVFNRWLLAEAALLVGDSRAETFRTDAVSCAISAQDGLDAQGRSIMLEQMLLMGRNSLRSQEMVQAGAQSREKL